jgi:carbon monoxide dehydrogenase subunit G
MARFESRNVSTARVPAPRADIWAIVTSPESLAELTPLIDRISADGDVWCWKLKRISALGVHVEPSFTELMTFDDGRKMTFEHRPPPATTEMAGARGVYTLADGADGGTDLSVDITIHVDLPLPAISRRAVQRVMASLMARTGDKFAENLYARLGIAPGTESKLQRAGG